ncbi:sulfatase [Halobacteriales archaeon QS_4_69_34]|nr:MAG: sulfatase [Halobacteriales archaeon QS_4_69_34]
MSVDETVRINRWGPLIDSVHPKNVVLIVMDTARAADTGVPDGSPPTTPTLRRLADQGTAFTNAAAAAPWTLPSHASLFTGTYPSKHGAHAGHKRLDGSLPTLTEAFRNNGYETVAVSNNTWISEEFGFGRGFETFRKTWQYVQSDIDLGQVARTTDGGIETARALATRLAEGNPLINVTNAIYGQFFRKRDDDGAARTNEWIAEWLRDRNRERPFFLFVNYLEPHLEYRPPEQYAEQFLPPEVSYREAMTVPQDAWSYIAGETDLSERDFAALRGLYRGEIAYLDDRIGELKTALVKAGEWEDTVFVITSDHGENIGDHGLMDHQYCLYDTLLHVPLVVHGGAFTDGGTVDHPVQLVDLPPTLLDATGIDAPSARSGFQGRSFHPDTSAPAHTPTIAEYIAPQPSMEALERQLGDLPDRARRYDRSLRAVRTGEHKLIRGSDGARELYRIRDDPWETGNIAERNPETVAELEAALDKWLDSFEHATVSGPVTPSKAARDRLEELGYLQ